MSRRKNQEPRLKPEPESKQEIVEQKAEPSVKKKRKQQQVQEDDFVEDDSGDHTSDEELDTDEDSAGSLVEFIVNDTEVSEVEEKSTEEEEQVQLVESAVYENGVRRSTRNRKPVERYVDSDYEELMCADADPDAALESSEDEEEEDEDETVSTECSEESVSTDESTESD